MDEGKPTGPKPKWWSRPRSSAAPAEQPRDTAPTADGDYALSAPAAPASPVDPAAPASPAGPVDPASPAAPTDAVASPQPTDAAAAVPAGADPHAAPSGSDPQAVPAGTDPHAAPAGVVPAGAGPQAAETGTDAHVATPTATAAQAEAAPSTATPTDAAPSAATPTDAVPPVAAADAAGAGSGSDAGLVAGSAEGTPTTAGAPAAAGGGADSAERPSPLHEPDPYSTPPYGGPGPWAPAPPVQHPVATPAQGTALPHGAVPPQETYPAGPQPIPGGAPIPGAPVPPQDAQTQPAPGQGAAAQPPHVTQPHGVQIPQQPSATHPQAPAHAQAPTQAPAAPHVQPMPPGAQDQPAPDYGHPAPAPLPPQGQAAPVPGQPAPGQPLPAPGGPAPTPGLPTEAQQPAATPWATYDPWNPQQPLLQNSSAVGAPKQKSRRGLLLVGAIALALVTGGIGGGVGAYIERNGGLGGVELDQSGAESIDRAPDSVAGIAASALPSVVTLHVSGDGGAGTGTGFVLDRKGHILTNNHVVEPGGSGGEISVTFSGGETASAEIVGRDAGYDLAVVKVSGVKGLKPLPLGNSDNVRVGDPVVAIGAPFDLSNTVTSGIISAKERPITAGGESGTDVSYVNALQTDAPINPGNSGGPLVDSKARVIGINSAIRSTGGADGEAGSIGLGFAIPINQGKRVAEQLIEDGHATHPVIEVTLDSQFYGDGAKVADEGAGGTPAVKPGGPADKAGIESGDVITEVDGQKIHSAEELIVKIRSQEPGDRLELTIERDGKEREVTLTLGEAGD